jgi:hypothetical protein
MAVAGAVKGIRKHFSRRLDPSVQDPSVQSARSSFSQPSHKHHHCGDHRHPMHCPPTGEAFTSGHKARLSNRQPAVVQPSRPQPGFPPRFRPRSSTSSNSKTGSGRESGRALSSPSKPYPAGWNFYRPRCICGGTGAGIAHRKASLQSMIYINAPMGTGLRPRRGFYTSGGISNTRHFPAVSSVGCRRPYASSGRIRVGVRTGG